jgi:cytochrome c
MFKDRLASALYLGLFYSLLSLPCLAGKTPAAVPEPSIDTVTASALLHAYQARPVQPWRMPDANEIPQNAEGKQIRDGMALLQQTTRLAGPLAQDPSKRYSRNNLNCVNCHQAGPSGLPGTKPYALPLVNVLNDYPKLDPKSMRMISLEQRVAGMFGKGEVALTAQTPELQAILAYLRWLGSKAEPGQAMTGSGLKEIPLPRRAADPERGRGLFAAQCAKCHGASGEGTPAVDFASGGGYLFPPVAGDDTYDDGGHMYMVPLLTRFIHANMPLGSSAGAPQLSVDEAYDIAAYINSELPRRHAPQRIGAYPDSAFRPAGFAIPEHFPNDPEGYRRARFGPFGEEPHQ